MSKEQATEEQQGAAPVVTKSIDDRDLFLDNLIKDLSPSMGTGGLDQGNSDADIRVNQGGNMQAEVDALDKIENEGKTEENASGTDSTDILGENIENQNGDAAKLEETLETAPSPELDKVEGKPENWEDVVANLEKRNKDTKASFTKGQQELSETRKAMETLQNELKSIKETLDNKASKIAEVDDEKFISQFKDKIEENETEGVIELVKGLLARNREQISKISKKDTSEENVSPSDLEARIAGALLAHQEAEMRATEPDFDDIAKVFADAAMTNPSLKQKWIDGGKSAKLAYTLGKKISQTNEIINDPDGFKAKLRKEIEDEVKNAPPLVPNTLASIPTSNGDSNIDKNNRKVFNTADEVLADVLGLT